MTMRVVKVPGMGDVQFPAEMTDEQVVEAIQRNLGPPQDPERAKRMAALPQSMRNIDADSAQVFAEGAPKGWERVGRGAMDIAQGTKQGALMASDAIGATEGAAPAYTQQVNDEIGLYERGRANAGQTGMDWGRVGGQALATAPLMLLPGAAATTFGGRVGAGAIGGGASGAAMFAPTGNASEKAANTAIGAGIGAAASPLVGWGTDKLGAGLKAMWGRGAGRLTNISDDEIRQAIPGLESLDPAVQRDLIAEAQAMVRQTGQFDPEQLARKANIISQGGTPTKSMVTRDPGDWARERNLSKLGQSPDEQLGQFADELTDVYKANDSAFGQNLSGKVRNPGTAEQKGMVVMKSLDELADASQEDVGKLYAQVRTARGEDLASDARQVWTTLDDLRDNTYAEKLVSSVTNKLRRFGMIGDDGELLPKTLTVTQAEELRKFVNKLPNDFGKRDIIRAIDEDVMGGLGDDAFAQARGAAAERFQMLDNPATQRALGTLGELQQGKAAQGFIQQQIVSGADQDVGTLIATLNKIADPTKRETAFTALRDGVLLHLQNKAVNPNSGQFSGAALNKALTEIGDEKLLGIFGMQGAQELKNLARAGLDATYQPPYAAVNSSNTAPMLMGLVNKGQAMVGLPLPGLNEAAQRAAARSGYAGQLAEAMAARGRAPPPQIPGPVSRSAEELAAALRVGAGPATYGSFDQARKRAKN